MAQTLLEAADDLERALSAVGEDVQGGCEALVEGVRLSLGVLHRRIAAVGAQRIPVVGFPFDSARGGGGGHHPHRRRRDGRHGAPGDPPRLPDWRPDPAPRAGPGRPHRSGVTPQPSSAWAGAHGGEVYPRPSVLHVRD